MDAASRFTKNVGDITILAMSRQTIYVCGDRWCATLGAEKVYQTLTQIENTDTETTIEQCRCLGYCEQGVNAMKQGKIYHELTEENVIEQLTGTGTQREFKNIEITDEFLGDI